MSSSDAPSAAVRTITPPSFTSRRLRMSLQARCARRRRAGARRRGPRPAGRSTTKRPGSEICGRQPRALRLHRVLDRLDEDRLAALRSGPGSCARGPSRAPGDDLVDVEEAVLLEADLDERGLHAGQDVVDAAEVDVARDRAALRPLEVDLGDLAVLEDGDALLADVDGDEQLTLRGGKRRRGAAARGVGAATGRGGAPAAATARASAAAWSRPSPSARARWRLRWSRASSDHDPHDCRGVAWAWTDRSTRPRRRPVLVRVRASPRARACRRTVGRRKAWASGNGTRAKRNSFLGWRAAATRSVVRARSLYVKRHGIACVARVATAPAESVRARTYDPAIHDRR